jgi:transcriptional regulator with XRE-family HTH domain
LEIGKRIKNAREALGMTQQELADALGIRFNGRQRVSQWENGHRVPGRLTIARIAEILEVAPAYIAYGPN